MAELVDAHVSGACVRKDVRVRLPLSALVIKGLRIFFAALFYCLVVLEPDFWQ